jgi:Ca2+-binding RTX toxin-like protein
MIGGGGADRLEGDAAANVFAGNAGNDTLSGRGGNDTLFGNTGADTADFAYLATGFTATLDSAGTATVTAAAGDTDRLVGIENILGGTGADRLVGDDAANVLTGGGGDDTLRPFYGNDTLDGGLGRDLADFSYVAGASVNFTITLDAGGTVTVTVEPGDTDSLLGIEDFISYSGHDSISGDANANWIQGRDGNDSLFGAGGDDTLAGGNGNDTLGGGVGNDRLLGEAGTNVASYSYLASTALNVTLDAAGTVTVTVAGGDTDTLEGIVGIVGGGGSDVLRGDSGANLISGGIGADTIRGFGGDDTLEGGDGNDIFQISGTSEGIDTVNGGSGSDTILSLTSASVLNVASGLTNMVDVEKFEGTGIDTILGTTGNDVLDFSARTVTGFLVSGGAGNDDITMTGADDSLRGDAGNDVLRGGAGNDTADYGYASTGFTATLGAGVTVTVTVAAGTDQDTLVSIENIVGGSGNDKLVGDGVANSISGGSGNDLLDGGTSDDTLFGGDGNDTLVGGFGSDTMNGGSGLDVAEYVSDPSASAGIYLRKATGGFTVSIGGDQDFLSGIEYVWGGDGGDTLSMRDASSFDDAATLLGGNGSDVLVGRSGLLTGPPGLSDTLQGGSGSDSYYLVGRAEVSGDVLYDNSKGLPVIENIEDFTETIQIYSGTSYTGDYFGGFFELVQISGGYDGTNSGYGTPGVAVVVVDTTPGGYLYLDTDVTQPGYSVLARVLNGAENLTTGNVSIVDGTMTPPP